jgi:arylsulfatase A-like enzyme
VKWPGKVVPGSSSDLISAQFDLMATLSDITGTPAWKNDGISYLPTLLGHASKQILHPYLYWEYPEKGGQVAIRMGRYKGVRSNMIKVTNAPWEVYDLQADPAESNDVSAQHPELVQQFETIMHKEHDQAHLREWEFIDPKFK